MGMDAASSPRLAQIAALMANEARAAMLLALLDGRAWTATELARAASIARPTATEHLHRLVQGGLISEVRQGRHRYLRIDDPAVADVIESLGALSGQVRPAEASWRSQVVDQELREARTCYRHLAGRLGVAVADGLRESGAIDEQWRITTAGSGWFAGIGVDIPTHPRAALVRPCLDWTERRDHLAGALPDALTATFLARGWLVRGSVPRAVRMTDAGRHALRDVIPDVDLAARP